MLGNLIFKTFHTASFLVLFAMNFSPFFCSASGGPDRPMAEFTPSEYMKLRRASDKPLCKSKCESLKLQKKDRDLFPIPSNAIYI